MKIEDVFEIFNKASVPNELSLNDWKFVKTSDYFCFIKYDGEFVLSSVKFLKTRNPNHPGHYDVILSSNNTKRHLFLLLPNPDLMDPKMKTEISSIHFGLAETLKTIYGF